MNYHITAKVITDKTCKAVLNPKYTVSSNGSASLGWNIDQ